MNRYPLIVGLIALAGCSRETDVVAADPLPTARAAGKTWDACTPLTAAPGEMLWDIELGADISSPPTFDGNMAWFGSINGDTQFFSVRDDGTIMAQVDIKYGVEQAVTLNDDATAVYVNTINMHNKSEVSGYLSDGVTPAGRGRGTQMLDAETLELLAYNGGGDLGGRDSSPALSADGSTLYVASIDRGPIEVAFYALDAETMEEVWQWDTPGWTYSAPVMDGKGNIYFGSEVTDSEQIIPSKKQGQVTALSALGTEKWAIGALCEATGGPVVYQKGRQTNMVSLDRCGVVRKLSPRNGNVLWEYDLSIFTLGAPVMGPNNATVLVPSGPTIPATTPPYESMMVAFNESTGAIEWTYAFDNQDTPAIVGDNAIYLVGQDGVVIALDHDGNELWTYATGYPMHRGFAGLNECGMLQFGTDDGHYLAFATESTGLDTTSDCPTYRCDYHRTGRPF